MALLIHSPVEISPLTTYLNIGLIDVPARSPSWATPGPAQALLHFRGIVLYPAIQRTVIEMNATLFHHLFQIAIADAVFAIPTHCPENDLSHKVPPFEITAHLVCASPGMDLLADSIFAFASTQLNFCNKTFPRDRSLIPVLAARVDQPGSWFALSNFGIFSKEPTAKAWARLAGPKTG